MKKALLAAVFSTSSLAYGQLVCIGSTKQCQLAEQKVCANEPVPANLTLPVAESVNGSLNDQSGAPLQRVGVWLKAQDGHLLISADTDENGKFELGSLAAGEYRVVIWTLQSGKPQRFGFDQPTKQVCKGSTECSVRYVLKATPTDHAVNLCPPN